MARVCDATMAVLFLDVVVREANASLGEWGRYAVHKGVGPGRGVSCCLLMTEVWW